MEISVEGCKYILVRCKYSNYRVAVLSHTTYVISCAGINSSVFSTYNMANPSQLFLLADHIKLSLLERQRAISLDLEPNAQDGNISRSLESMREGIEAIE